MTAPNDSPSDPVNEPDDTLASLRARLRQPCEVAIDLNDGHTLTLVSAWGLFSSRSLDEGTALLLRELAKLPIASFAPEPQIADLGCGYGALGLALATACPAAYVTLIDKDVLAVETVRRNIERNQLTNARAVLSPGFRDAPPGLYHLIVSDLPAQAGNDAIDELLLDMHDHLAPGGLLVVVTVRGLRRYLRRRLEVIFGNYHKSKQGPRHAVAEAIRQ